MKKGKILFLVLIVSLLACVAFACGDKKSTVTFYDGTTVLKTVKVEKGGTVEEYTPTVAGKTFKGWYATPNFLFDFKYDRKIEEDTKVFGKFRPNTATADTRTWKLAGDSAKGGDLKSSNWNKGTSQKKTLWLAKTADAVNEYAVTLDLYAGDEFQLVEDKEGDAAFNDQHGFGYVRGANREHIDGVDNVYEPSQQLKANIKIIKDGSYKIDMYTNLESPATMDEINITRQGNPSVDKTYIVKPNLSGTVSAGGLLAADKMGKMELKYNDTSKLYETNCWLNRGDFFSIMIDSSWSFPLRTGALTDDSDNYDTSDLTNITVTKSGNYDVKAKIVLDKLTGLPVIKDCNATINYKDSTYVAVAGDTTITLKVEGKADELCYIKADARMPQVVATVADKAFKGWYKDNNTAIEMEKGIATTADGITLTAKFITASEFDTRAIYALGYNGWSPAEQNFDAIVDAVTPSNNKPAVKSNILTQTENSNIYTITIESTTPASLYLAAFDPVENPVSGDGMLTNSKPSNDTRMGLFYKANMVKTGADLIKSVKNENINFKEGGKYTVTFNSLTSEISIVKLAA